MLQRCAFLSARSILIQGKTFATEANDKKLQEYQKKYRTSASDILSMIPHDGIDFNDENGQKLNEYYAKYYEDVGAHIQYELNCRKAVSSTYHEESCNYYNSKILDHSLPFYSATHFPLLSVLSENQVVTEESFLDSFANFMGVSGKERPMFDDAIIHSDVLPDDSWVLELQKEFHDTLDDLEDKQQDAIDDIERDLGTNNHKCDVKGFFNLLEEHTNPELFELEKKHMMTPEEIEDYNYIEAMRVELKNTEIGPIPTIPDLED